VREHVTWPTGIYPPQVAPSISTAHSHQWMLHHAELNTRWLHSTWWLRGMYSAWRNRGLLRKMRTNFQVNQKQEQDGTSQILNTKPFQMQAIRKLLVMVSILVSLLLFPFYSSTSLISFSISMSSFYHFLGFLYSIFSLFRILHFVHNAILNFTHSLPLFFFAPNSFYYSLVFSFAILLLNLLLSLCSPSI
jgi:hypothetical protein